MDHAVMGQLDEQPKGTGQCGLTVHKGGESGQYHPQIRRVSDVARHDIHLTEPEGRWIAGKAEHFGGGDAGGAQRG